MSTQHRAPRVSGLGKVVETVLAYAAQPISSRRICFAGGLPDDQAAHVSSELSNLRRKGLVEVTFGSDPDYPKTDRLYSATPKLRALYP